MYVPMVIALMLVVPLIFVTGQLLLNQHGMLTAVTIIPIIAKWYVFWAVGARLGLAGLRQIIQPRYTAQTILGIKSEDPLLLVRELGIANTAIGSIGLAALFVPSWVLPAAQQIAERCHGVGSVRGPGAGALLPGALGYDGDAFRLWIEHDPGLAALQLTDHPRNLVLQ
jgi:hypothetical protein